MRFYIFYIVLLAVAQFSLVRSLGTVSPDELSALQSLYDSTNGAEWRWQTNGTIWNFSVPNPSPCAPLWQGLICNCSSISCNVTQIDLRYYRLTGSIPAALGNLVALNSLILSNNNIDGSLPKKLGKLVNLVHLDVSFNYLRYSIPSMFANLTQLVFLNLRQNALTGPVPADMFNLRRLQFLRVNLNRLTGTIPESIGNLTQLTHLDLSINNFHGEIVSNLCNLTKLEYMYVHHNFFDGIIPECFCRFPSLLYVYINVNQLTGSIPNCVGDLRGLRALAVEENRLTGSIPESLQLLNDSLLALFVDLNKMTGTIPPHLFNATNSKLAEVDLSANNFTGRLPEISLPFLLTFDLRENFLSGTISNSIRYSEELYYFDVAHNYLSGTIPEKMGSLKVLDDLFLNGNAFTGPIPESDIEHVSMYQYQIDNNLLTGSIPQSFCYINPQYIDMGSNLLEGTLPDCSNSSGYKIGTMVYYTVSDNYFSGLLPQYIQNEPHAVALTLNNNLLSGTVPLFNCTNVLQYLYLQMNNLEGTIPLDASYTALSYVDVSNNQFTGTLPKDLFHVNSSVISFAATSNCITGSIPHEICDVSNLVYLELDGLTTAQNCRSPIFPGIESIKTFYLKEQITGGVPECLFSMPLLSVLHLSGNSIDWSFPKNNFVLSDSLSQLLLSHNKITGTIPDIVQNRKWSLLDLSFNKLTGTLDFIDQYPNTSLVLQVNRLSGGVPDSILSLESINILNGNLFGCNFQRDGLPEHDEYYTTYQCGSNSFDEAAIIWSVFAVIFASMVVAYFLKFGVESLRVAAFERVTGYVAAIDFNQADSLASFKHTLLYMNKCNISLTAGVVIVFLPLYGVLTEFYKTAEYQYAWTVSSAYLAGATPAVILWLFYTSFVVVLYILWYKTKAIPQLFHAVFIREDRNEKIQSKPSRYFFLVLVVLFNCVVMVLVNGLYLRIILNGTEVQIFFAQISIALFKLLWNDFAIRWTVVLARRAYRNVTTDMLVSAIDKNDRIAEEMPFTSFIILFNCIIAPVLVTAAVDNNCFLNVFVTVSPVTAQSPSFSVVGVCDYYVASVVGNSSCITTNVESFIEVTYDPPFIYSYQCASSILKNYVAVYVYMYLAVGFLKPFGLMVISYFYSKIPEQTCLRMLVDNTIYELLKPARVAALERRRVHFFKERFALRMIGKIGVFITFGVIFPPVAVVVSAAFASEICLNLIMIGRFLVRIPDNEMRIRFRELLCRDCEGCLDLILLPLVRLVVPFAAVFYSFFVFDTYGDKVGFKQAVWAPVVLCVTPLLIWMWHRMRKIYVARDVKKRTTSLSRGSEMVTKSSLKSLGLSEMEEDGGGGYFG